jgi:Zn-dependent protease with chaperone function
MNFALLVRAVNLFVVGHEYGHLIRGDLDHGAAARHVLPGAIVAEEISHSWRAEFAADEIGLRLSAIALNQLEVVLAGATVFLSGVGVMDRAVSLLRTGDENAQRIGSHPPSTARVIRLRQYLDDRLGGQAAEALHRGRLVLVAIENL